MSVQEKQLIIYISIFGVALVILISLLFYIFYTSRKKILLEKFEAKRRYQEQLNNITLEIQDQTLKNVGRELHDNLGQKLTLANLQLGTMKINDATQVEQHRMLGETLQQSIKDLRSLSKTLNSDVVANNGLLYSIEQEVARLNRLNYINVELNVVGETYRLNQEKELVVFRIFQETINNTLKHAEATSLLIQLQYEENRFQMNLKDDGQGFDLEENFSSAGLKNMKNRAVFIQAKLNIHSDIGKGTKLSLTLNI